MSYESVGYGLDDIRSAAHLPDNRSIVQKGADWLKGMFGSGTPPANTGIVAGIKATPVVVETPSGSKVVSGGLSQTTMLIGAAALIGVLVYMKKKKK